MIPIINKRLQKPRRLNLKFISAVNMMTMQQTETGTIHSQYNSNNNVISIFRQIRGRL
jgi:hypothetical protein